MKNHLVTKSNDLIEARYKLTVEEQRLILYLVSLIQPTDDDFTVYTISVKDFMEMVGIQNRNLYRQFKSISGQLMGKPLVIKKDASVLVLNWLSSAEYYSGQGKIEVSFDPKLKPYLIKLKANFTSYRLKNIITLKSFYSIRIYELLKQYERMSERTFPLETLRAYLGIDDSRYPIYSNFKQKVLNVAYNELKEKTDLYFEYEEIKQHRKVEKIRFIIHKKQIAEDDGPPLMIAPPSAASPQKEDIEEIRRIIDQPLTDEELLSILRSADGDIALVKRRYAEAKTKQQLRNLVGFMIWACKEPDEKFAKRSTRGRNRFANFEGRKMDFEAIERMEREQIIRELTGK